MLTWDQYGRAVRQARGELEKSSKPQKLEAARLVPRPEVLKRPNLVYQTNRERQQAKDDLSAEATEPAAEDQLPT